MSDDAIRIYEALFWNVRDRDRIYICSLVYPEGRQVEFVPGYALNEDPMNLALGAALDHGIELVEEILGLKNPVEDVNGVEHAKALADRILSAANFMAKIGGLHQDLPALANARQVLRMAYIGSDVRLGKADIKVVYGYMGEGCGVVGNLEREAIRLMARCEGIVLDPVYAGRAFGALHRLSPQKAQAVL